MIRKLTLLLLLCIGIHGFVNAQTLNTVTISLPFGTDTTCPGEQLTFTAVQGVDTFSTTTYAWYTNSTFTGVTIDTFYTTALSDGDTVWCVITYVNSAGTQTAMSNKIVVHRSSSFDPYVLISLTTGSNPDCPGSPLTFTAYSSNGGPNPVYQWLINGTPVTGATTNTFTHTYSDTDTVSCMMVSNSPCATPGHDTVYSNEVPIIHTYITATISIAVTHNPICAGTLDSFTATVGSAGVGSSIDWYVNSTHITGAIGNIYVTDSLHDNDHVYAILTAHDACVINDTTVSNEVIMTVVPNLTPMVSLALTHGANPGCKDSAITYTATATGLGTAPTATWYVNGVVVATNVMSYTQAYANGDLLTFKMHTTDGGCYTVDSILTPAVLMVRDTAPVAPLISLIGNLLVANTAGTYIWYYNGVIIPGANGQTYHPTVLGDYYAIRDTGNCQSKPSNIIYISLLDVNKVATSNIKVFPNPTSGILNIDMGSYTGGVKMDVYNIVGQGLLHQDLNGGSRITTDLSYLPEGSYMVVLRLEDGTANTYKIQLTK